MQTLYRLSPTNLKVLKVFPRSKGIQKKWGRADRKVLIKDKSPQVISLVHVEMHQQLLAGFFLFTPSGIIICLLPVIKCVKELQEVSKHEGHVQTGDIGVVWLMLEKFLSLV